MPNGTPKRKVDMSSVDWERWRGTTDNRLQNIEDILGRQVEALEAYVEKNERVQHEASNSAKTVEEKLAQHIESSVQCRATCNSAIESANNTAKENAGNIDAVKARLYFFAGSVSIILPVLAFLAGMLIMHIRDDKPLPKDLESRFITIEQNTEHTKEIITSLQEDVKKLENKIDKLEQKAK